MLIVEPGVVRQVRLNRPEVRNAFNLDLIEALHAAFDEPARVVVLSGQGRAFCAGGDLDWMRRAGQAGVEQNRAEALRLAELFAKIAAFPGIVIARVHGAVMGGGAGLVAAADVALAERTTQFCFSEARLGLVPATISPFVVPKIGAGHARALFATAASFGADHALRIGLVHEVADEANLNAATDRWVRAALQCGPEAASACKVLAQQAPLGTEEAAMLLAETRSNPEAREGLSAFLEKRRPTFAQELE